MAVLADAKQPRAVSRRPRLLYLITLAEVGGAQSYLIDLLDAVVADFDVTVAAHGDGPLVEATRRAGARFVPLSHVRRPLSPLRDLLGLYELWRLCRRLSPDIVHANSSKAGVLGRVAAFVACVPVRIFTAHGWAFKAASGAASVLYLWADRLLRPLTSAVVCVSEEERRAGLAARTCSPEATVMISNGVDVAAVPPRRHEERVPVRFVSVGRLAEPKDFTTLLHAMRALRSVPVELTVVGDGPLRAAVAQQVADLDLAETVTLAGEVRDVRRKLGAYDGFVLASWSEGLPISLLEAGAAGLPAVVSDVGGTGEIVEEAATGFLVAPGDPQALAARIAVITRDAQLRATMGAAARARIAARFSVASCREAHLALYRRLLRDAGVA